jgi:hypothetical protein
LTRGGGEGYPRFAARRSSDVSRFLGEEERMPIQAKVLEALKLFGEEVIPEFR